MKIITKYMPTVLGMITKEVSFEDIHEFYSSFLPLPREKKASVILT
jgi:hypothetical protein